MSTAEVGEPAILAPPRGGPLRGRVLGPEHAEEARRAWARIADLRGGLPAMRDWPWTAAWLRHYGDAVPSSFVLVEDDAGVVHGVALLGRTRRWFGPVPIRSLWVGAANAPLGQEICAEFSPVLARPGREADATRAVIEAARGLRGWDQLRADGVPLADARAFAGAWPEDRTALQTEPAPLFRLADLAPEADVASGLPGGPRRRARASLRALETRGPLTVEWATEPDHAADVFEELVALHQARWTADGEPGLFAPGRFADTHRALVPELAAAGRAVLFRLRADGATIGCLYLLADGDRLAFYQSGLEVFDDNRLRPGLVTHLRCMEEARARGFAVYDFLSYDARYKRELSNDADRTVRIALRRRRLRLWAYDRAVALRERWRGRAVDAATADGAGTADRAKAADGERAA